MKDNKDKVKVLVTQQGDAACGEYGYMLKRSENIAAFYLDGWGVTGRIYCNAYSNSTYFDGKVANFPELCIDDGQDDSSLTTICFPEYEGWSVHCAGGGKTMAVCLIKE